MSGTSAQRLPTLIGRRLDFHRVMTVVVALEIVAIVVLAAITVKQFQVFGIDEGAHLSYIEVVADHGRLPWLGRDPSAWQAQAIDQGTFPRHSPTPASKAGLVSGRELRGVPASALLCAGGAGLPPPPVLHGQDPDGPRV